MVWFKKIPNLWFGLTFFGAISPVGVAKWPLRNILGAFRQSHWRNALTEPNRTDRFGSVTNLVRFNFGF